MESSTIAFWIVCALVGWFLPDVVEYVTRTLRKHVSIANPVLDAIRYPWDVLCHYSHFLIPDSIYQLWYQTGIMDADDYRYAQEQGYISSDLDPEYIQEVENNG